MHIFTFIVMFIEGLAVLFLSFIVVHMNTVVRNAQEDKAAAILEIRQEALQHGFATLEPEKIQPHGNDYVQTYQFYWKVND